MIANCASVLEDKRLSGIFTEQRVDLLGWSGRKRHMEIKLFSINNGLRWPDAVTVVARFNYMAVESAMHNI